MRYATLPEMPAVLETVTLGQVATLLAVILFLIMVIKQLKKIILPIQEFLSDWNGTVGRPGVDAKPGVMERLDSLEQGLNEVKHEVMPNSGKSMHDKVEKIRAAVAPEEQDK